MKGLLDKVTKTGINRRSFLKLTAITSIGLGLSTGCKNQLKEVDKIEAEEIIEKEGEWITAACWHNCGGRCLNKAYVVDGVVLKQKTDDVHEDSPDFPQQRACARGRSQRKQVFNADRIKYPMKRKNWEPGGGKKELRGQDEWERISWDEALDIVSSEIKRIKEGHGQDSILAWGSEIERTLSAYGGVVSAWGNTSWGTWYHSGPDMGVGDGWMVRPINDRFDMRNSDLIVMWGVNPAWSSGNNGIYNYIQAKEAGAKFIFIDPYLNDSARILGDDWIPIRPATDHTFALAVAHTLLVEDDPETNPLIDWDFLNKYTVGFDENHMPEGADKKENYKDYVLGVHDGQPKSAEWASEYCGVDPEVIKEFAREYAKAERAALITGWAPARVHNADSWPQAFMTLGFMTGNIGSEGKMTGISCHFVAGNGGPELIKSGGTGLPSIENPSEVTINNSEIWDAIIEGKYIAGKDDVRDCNIQMIYHGGASRLNQLCGATKGIEAHRTVEFVVANHYSFNTNAKYADIVFPITTQWERDGYYKGNQEALFFATQVVEPLYEAKDDMFVATEIAKKLGIDPTIEIEPHDFKQRVFNQTAGAQVIKDDGVTWENLVQITAEDIKELGVKGEPQEGRITYKQLVEDGTYQVKRSPGDKLTYIHLKDFIDDPEGNPLDTDTGKLEIYCKRIADRVSSFGFTEMSPIPKYDRPTEGYEDTFKDWENKEKGEFPLQLFTIHHQRRSHSIFDNVGWLRESFPHELIMNPEDGKAIGVNNGDIVKIESRHGAVIRPVQFTERILPGVVTLGQGAWIDIDEETGIDKGGNTNILNGGIATGQGHMGWNSCNVKIGKYDYDLLPDHEVPSKEVL